MRRGRYTATCAEDYLLTSLLGSLFGVSLIIIVVQFTVGIEISFNLFAFPGILGRYASLICLRIILFPRIS